MNIDWLIPCRYVEVHDGLGTLIGAGADTIGLVTLPAPVQLAVAIRVTGTADELDHSIEHPVRNIIRGPDDAVLSDIEGVIQIGIPDARAGWLTGIIIPTVIQFMAEHEGAYRFEFHIDDAQLAVPLHVVVARPDD